MVGVLTLEGKEPNQEALKNIRTDASGKTLENKIKQLFTSSNYFPILFTQHGRFSFHHHGQEYYSLFELEYSLLELPQDHEIVQGIIRYTKSELERVPNMSVEELMDKDDDDDDRFYTLSLNKALDLAGLVKIEALYEDLKKAAYHIIQQHGQSPNDLPYGKLIADAITSLYPYAKSHRDEVLQFFEFCEQQHIKHPYVIRGYVEVGSERAITLFIEAVKQEQKMDFNYVGERIIKKKLVEIHNFSEDVFQQYVNQIEDPTVKSKVKEYFKLP